MLEYHQTLKKTQNILSIQKFAVTLPTNRAVPKINTLLFILNY